MTQIFLEGFNRKDFNESNIKNPILTKSFNAKILDINEIDELFESKKGIKNIEKAKVLDNIEGKGFIAGYLSYFNNVDLDGDIIRPGAFTKTLKERTPKVLFNHNKNIPIGKIIEVFEDSKGLFAIIELNLEVQAAKDVYSHLKFGALDSFSIGFKLTRFELLENNDGSISFDILEVKLFEASVVAIPANEQAIVTEIKDKIDESFKSKTEEINKVIKSTETIDDLIKVLTALVDEKKSIKNDITDEIVDIFIDGLNDTPDSVLKNHLSDKQAAEGQMTKTNTPLNIEDEHLLDTIIEILNIEE